MKWINEIVDAYGIVPQHIEQITASLYKIEVQNNHYALKQSQLNKDSIVNWEYTYRQADALQLNHILPVYLNRTKQLYYKTKDKYYYLMPWIDGGPCEIDIFYQSVGKWHAGTKKKQKINNSNRISAFEDYNIYCQDLKKKLLHYVEQFESHLYMSPFELQVCMSYQDMNLVLNKLTEQLKAFITYLKDQSEWSTSICHGNLALSHLLMGDQPVMINWEKSFVGNAIFDLVHFFNNEIGDYNPSFETYISSFSSYMNQNKLEQSECYLLLIYLLNPTPYMTTIEEYVSDKENKSMIALIKELQHSYRRLIFALEFSKFIEQPHEDITEEV